MRVDEVAHLLLVSSFRNKQNKTAAERFRGLPGGLERRRGAMGALGFGELPGAEPPPRELPPLYPDVGDLWCQSL